ncbi:hypothetical protein NDU88_002614 [Pleurodeles waltl]|uniref:Uncharacterized protein n=1 Tax=Pleurodeles waltl TaxID=8319 RepID=A0AAV7UW39_PLEWA|nr:hypothetical protein NDU88_002614 [Pleurodeles waltl]
MGTVTEPPLPRAKTHNNRTQWASLQRKETPGVFPRGTVGRIFFQDNVYFRGHNPKRLTSQERVERRSGDEEEMQTKPQREGKSRQLHREKTQDPLLRDHGDETREHQELDAEAERPEDIYTMEQPCQVPGAT